MHAMTEPAALSIEQWQNHIAAWKDSGNTQANYCQQHGLVPHTFWYWKKKLSAISAPSARPSPAPFIPVAVVDEPAPARAKQNACNAAQSITTAISVHIGNGNGCRIDLLPGFDPATLRQALAVLRD